LCRFCGISHNLSITLIQAYHTRRQVGLSARMSRDVRSSSLQMRGAPRPKHNQRLDGSAPVTKVSVNIKVDVQRVGLNLCKSGLGSAYGAGV
jgi:hypothetical protein